MIRRGALLWRAAERAAEVGQRGRWAQRGRPAARRLAAAVPPGARVHLGCGPHRFDGWVNVDYDSRYRPDVVHDLRLGFPLAYGRLSAVYSEHVLEHFTLEE